MCNHWSPIILSTVCAIVLVIYGSFLRFISSCGCLQGQEFIQINCITCKSLTELFGGYILTLFTTLSCLLVCGVYALTYSEIDSLTVTKTFLISKAMSLLYWFIYTIPYFAVQYPYDKERFFKKLPADHLETSSLQLSQSADQCGVMKAPEDV